MRIIFIVISLLTSVGALAGDEALYGKPPPPDAVFFRVLNLSSETLEVKLQGNVLINLDSQSVSPYGFASSGQVDIALNGKAMSLPGPAKSQYTLVYSTSEEAPLQIEEELFDNKRQARLAVYNLSTVPNVTLKSVDGKHTIIENVALGDAETRDVRAIKIATAVHDAEGEIAQTGALKLARDKVTSIFVLGDNASASVLVAQAEQ